MPRCDWTQVDKSEHRHKDGHRIIAWWMAGKKYWLAYHKDQPLERGDYKTFETVRAAKQHVEKEWA